MNEYITHGTAMNVLIIKNGNIYQIKNADIPHQE